MSETAVYVSGSHLYGGTWQHPLQAELRGLYHLARCAWRNNPNVQAAALTLGMYEREYCDRYIQQFRLSAYTSTSAYPTPPLDHDRAYREAAP
jgi:hypothetical protein